MLSADFYPGNIEAKALWHAKYAANLPAFATKYNITPQQLAAAAADNEWIQFWVARRHAAATFASQLAAYFNSISGNDPSLDPPATPDFSIGAPPPEVPAGIEFRAREIARHIKGQSSYAEADGTLLGLIGESAGGGQGIGSSLTPDIQTAAANSGYQFTVTVSKRGAADAWQVCATITGQNKWQNIATATGRSATVVLHAARSGQPTAVPTAGSRPTAAEQPELRPYICHRDGHGESVMSKGGRKSFPAFCV